MPEKAVKPDAAPETTASKAMVDEALSSMDSTSRTATTATDIPTGLASDRDLLSQLDSSTKPATAPETFTRENGYTVTVEKDPQGQVSRIAEADGTEWTRSADGKSFTLKPGGEQIPVKDVEIRPDGTYSFKLENGGELRRNADRSVSSLDEQGRERQKTNSDGSQVLFDDKHRVTATIDGAGTRHGYGYDANGKLASIVEPDGAVWKSPDGTNWHKQGSNQTRSGEVSVSEDGTQTVKNARGETTSFKMDGSTVSRDKDGHVTAVKDQNGAERRFEYGEDGKLKTMTAADGSQWTTSDGKSWKKSDQNTTINVEISVDQDGTIHEKWAAGKEIARKTDGWQRITEGGQTREERQSDNGSVVTRNDAGQITSVKDAKGDVRSFEYDAQGRMSKMTDKTGTWRTNEKGEWTNEKNETFKGQREVTPDGIYREVGDDGKVKVFKGDGSNITAVDGRITRVEDARGNWREFQYDAQGKVNGFSDSKGAKLSTTDGVNWRNESTGETKPMSVNVRPDGSVEVRDSASGDRTLALTDGRNLSFDKNGRLSSGDNADGSRTSYEYDERGVPKRFTVTNPDNSKVTMDAQGRVVSTTSVDGQTREYEYGENGKLSKIKAGDGEVWTSSDGDNWTASSGEKWKGAVWVSPDGTYNTIQGETAVAKQLDGNTLYREPSGATRLENKAGQLVETVDAKGVKRTYERDANGQINKFTEGNETWTTTDGTNWTNGKTNWQGRLSVQSDGTYFQQDAEGNRQWRKPDGSRQDVNRRSMEAAADTIEYAMNGGTGAGTDEQTIYSTLENKTFAERQMIKEIWNEKYGKKYGHTLEAEFKDEMEGSDLDKANALLHRPDGADNAGTIRVALTERGEWTGRSSSELEKVVRNTLETMSSTEIAQTDAEYRRRYGMSLRDAVMNNPHLSADTKAAADIYLKGHDKRTPQDTRTLADRAVTSGDPTMFQEAMRRAPKEVRDYFASPAGQDAMRNAFEGHWYHALTFGLSGNVTDTNLQHVRDYAEHGKLSVSTQVDDNRSWLGDNEEAIEHSLANMSDRERQLYTTGRALARNEQPAPQVDADERKQAMDYYTKTHGALERAAGQWYSGDSQVNELAKWEDMIANKGGGLVSRLSAHRGTVYDSSMHEVIGSIEDMSKEDWQQLRNDPMQVQRVEQVLKTYLSESEFPRAMARINAMKDAPSFELAQQNRRPVLETIADNRRWYNNDEAQMYKAIERMSDREQALYREGSNESTTNKEARDFYLKLNQELRDSLDSSEQKVAFGLLDQVKRGEKPEMSIMDKLNLQASYVDSDEAQVIRDIQEAFKKDPTLRERIIHPPDTEEGRKFARDFQDAARRALGSYDYERYAKPLIETGSIPIERQMDLNRGVFDDDEQGAYRDIQNASGDEQQRILRDQAFQDRVLGFLSQDERKVALASMQQGEMRPEDKLRSYQIGMGTSEQEIKDTFAQLTDRTALRQEGKSEAEIDEIVRTRVQRVQDEYARKYGADLSADLVSELSGKDLRQVQRQSTVRDARGEFLYAQNDASISRSGIGSSFVDAAWDGTGYQLDNEINQLARTMVEDPAKIRDHVANVYKLVDMHADSKEGLANAVVDTTIAAVSVGGAFFTGGVSLSLLAYTGAGAALFKVGAKSAIMGGDYDWGSKAFLDAGTGFAEGFTAFLGAGVGKAAAEKVLAGAGKNLLREGAETTLKEGTEALLKQGLANGGKISDDAILSLARQIAKDGDEKAVAALLKNSLAESVEEQSRTLLKQIIMSTPENTLAGMAGSGLSGTIQAGADARDVASFLRQATTSTAFGALGGSLGPVLLAPGMVVAGKGWNALRTVASRERSPLQNIADQALHGVDAPVAHVTPDVPGHTPDVPGRKTDVPARTTDGPAQTTDVPPGTTDVPPQTTDVPPGTTDVPPRDGVTPAERPATSLERPTTPEGQVEPHRQPARVEEEVKPADAEQRVEGDNVTDRNRPVTDAPVRARDQAVDPARIREVSEQLAEIQNRPPIGRDQFLELLDKVPPQDRGMALELLEQSIPNLHRKALDGQLDKLQQQIGKLQEQGVRKITVVASEENSSGAALAYLLRTNTSMEVEIKVLNAQTIREGVSPSNPVLVLDDLASLSGAQSDFLRQLPKVYASDLNGFNSGLNTWELGVAKLTGSTETMQTRMAEMVEQAKRLKAENPNLTNEEAIQQVLRAPLDNAAKDFPNMEILRPELPARTQRTRNRSAENIYDQAISRPIYDASKNNFSMVSDKDVRSFLDNYRKPPEPGSTTGEKLTDAEKLAAATILRDTMKVNTYETMLQEMQNLNRRIQDALPPGKTMDDVVVLTRMEENGSSNLIHHLFGRTADLRSQNFVSAAEFQADPSKFKDKVLVYLDDYSFTGRQPEKLLMKPLAEGVGTTPRPLSEAIKESGAPVIVAHLGGYLPEQKLQSVFDFDAKFIYSHDGVLPQIFDSPALQQMGFTTDELNALVGNPGYVTKDPERNVDIAMLHPFRSHPTNNRSLVNDFTNRVLKEQGIRTPRVPGRKPQPVTEVSEGLYRAGATKSPEEFARMIEQTNADVVIDLRGGPGGRDELQSVADQAKWAADLAGKQVDVRNLGIPTEWPMRGTPNYNQLLDNLAEFERVVGQAQREGKNVLFHCYHGEDRTGLVNAFHDVIAGNKSIDEAMAQWKALGSEKHPGFQTLFNRQQFEQLVTDYRARTTASR